MYGTPEDVINLTGVTPNDLGLDEKDSPDTALNELLETWLTRISSAIDVRLTQESIDEDSDYYAGIVDVSVRTVAKLVAVGRQQRLSPVVQIGEFAVNIINTTQVIRDLEIELKPYQKRSFTFYSSYKPQ